MSETHPLLDVIDVWKRYSAQVQALRGVSLQVAAGEIVCLLGPSGSGKSTLLRIIAGLEREDSGRVVFDGQDLAGVPVHTRGFGLMFQDFALFPDKSVARNVAFGLRMEGTDKRRIDQRVDEMLNLVGLAGYSERSIFALSGGERQRVALARSLAPSPRLLMLDEPLGSLDRTLREVLLDELRGLLKRLGLTSVYVTHDQQEALAIADRVAILDHGELVQFAPPRELHQKPATPFVARFLGMANLLPATVEPGSPRIALTPLGAFPLAMNAQPGAYTLLIRPEATSVAVSGEPADPSLTVTVTELSFRGSHLRVEVRAEVRGGTRAGDTVDLVFHLPPGSNVHVGEEVTLRMDPAAITLLPSHSDPLHAEGQAQV